MMWREEVIQLYDAQSACDGRGEVERDIRCEFQREMFEEREFHPTSTPWKRPNGEPWIFTFTLLPQHVLPVENARLKISTPVLSRHNQNLHRTRGAPTASIQVNLSTFRLVRRVWFVVLGLESVLGPCILLALLQWSQWSSRECFCCDDDPPRMSIRFSLLPP